MRLRFAAVVAFALLAGTRAGAQTQVANCTPDGIRAQFSETHTMMVAVPERRMPLVKGCMVDPVAGVFRQLGHEVVVRRIAGSAAAGVILVQDPAVGKVLASKQMITLTASDGAGKQGDTETGTGQRGAATGSTGSGAGQGHTGPDSTQPVGATGSTDDSGGQATKKPRSTQTSGLSGTTGVSDGTRGATGATESEGSGTYIDKPPPAEGRCEISVFGTGPPAVVPAGSTVTFEFSVECIGSAVAASVRLTGTPNHLTGVWVDGGCGSGACMGIRLAAGEPLVLRVHGTPDGPGPFSYGLSARVAGANKGKGDAAGLVLKGSVPAGHAWGWWAAGGLICLGGIAGIFSGPGKQWRERVPRQREQRWMDGCTAVGSLGQVTGSAGPIPFTGPAISVVGSIEMGAAWPVGSVPITKEESV